jgi:Ras-related protein Rab-1A
MLYRFTDDVFSESFISTIGVDFKIKTININDSRCKLQIWDTAGQERFKTITSSYYRGAHGIILVYDVTNEASFKNLTKWLTEIDRYTDNKVIKIIVGNKIDSNDNVCVTYEQGEEFAKFANLELFYVSAKNNVNIDTVFVRLCEIIKSNSINKI